MACTNCGGCGGCSNCHCEETDVCQDNETLAEKLGTKVAFLKDYVCVLAASNCKSIIQRVSKYAFFVWCTLRDFMNVLMAHDRRLDCLENRIDELIEYLKKEALGKVNFEMKSKGTVSGPVSTTVTTQKDGSFKIVWTNAEAGHFVGSGTVTGKINHTYELNDDGSIDVDIKTVTIDKVVYSATATGSTGPARFVIKDKNDNVVFDKTYSAYQDWTETLNKTIAYNFSKVIEPGGESTGDFLSLKTEDTWQTNPTYGEVYINYTNNNDSVDFLSNRCGRCPEPATEETGGDANA